MKVSKELLEKVDPNNEACCDYHLMHLMKEWTYKYGHEMVSYHIQDSNEWRCLYAHISIDLNIDKRVGFYAETEFEAVTKACEYILEQLKDK